jgi:hypothetical protein
VAISELSLAMKLSVISVIITASIAYATPAEEGASLKLVGKILPLLGPPGDPVATVITPDGKHCYWESAAPFCAGKCPEGYIEAAYDKCGDGACCWTGTKSFSCK